MASAVVEVAVLVVGIAIEDIDCEYVYELMGIPALYDGCVGVCVTTGDAICWVGTTEPGRDVGCVLTCRFLFANIDRLPLL
jgi:hypothetical protein